jgi:hypothetical protein
MGQLERLTHIDFLCDRFSAFLDHHNTPIVSKGFTDCLKERTSGKLARPFIPYNDKAVSFLALLDIQEKIFRYRYVLPEV